MKYHLKMMLATMSASTCLSAPATALDIAVCGSSNGYGMYPSAGLAAGHPEAGKWVSDTIRNGRITLTFDGKKTDVLIADAEGGVFSSAQKGATVLLLGMTNTDVTVMVSYPRKVIEVYTFLRRADGSAEVIWTSNNFGDAIIKKVAAYRAKCSHLAIPSR